MFSPWYSYRLFREHTGVSVADYIRRLRLSRSALRLKNGKERIIDAAFHLGFGSVDGYTRAFRKEFGCNPAEYAREPRPITLFIPYLVFMAVYGVALTAVQTTITTLLQESTESSVQGRIFGLMSALYASCYPLGMALFVPMADIVPLQAIMMVSGIALMLMAAFVFFHFPYVHSAGNGVQCNQQ